MLLFLFAFFISFRASGSDSEFCVFEQGGHKFDFTAIKDPIIVDVDTCSGGEKDHQMVFSLCRTLENSFCYVTEMWTTGPRTAFYYYKAGYFCYWTGAKNSHFIKYGPYNETSRSMDITFEGTMETSTRPWKRTIVVTMVCDPNYATYECLDIDVDKLKKTTTYFMLVRSPSACPL